MRRSRPNCWHDASASFTGRRQPAAESTSQGEPRNQPVRLEQRHRPGLGGAHAAFLRRGAVIVSGEVQPAVHEVERQFLRKTAPAARRKRGRGSGRHADFARLAGPRRAVERDDVGGGGIIEERGV